MRPGGQLRLASLPADLLKGLGDLPGELQPELEHAGTVLAPEDHRGENVDPRDQQGARIDLGAHPGQLGEPGLVFLVKLNKLKLIVHYLLLRGEGTALAAIEAIGHDSPYRPGR